MEKRSSERSARIMRSLSARIRDIAEIRSRREWSAEFNRSADVRTANMIGRETYANTVEDLTAEFRRMIGA